MGKLAKFKRRIGGAFNDAVYPGDDRIIKDIQHYEIEDMHRDFQGKRCRDIKLETAEYWYDGTMLFTPEGFRYFLPAFLLADLHQNSAQIGGYLIYRLEPPSDAAEFTQFSETMNGFTEAQKSVIAQWVKRFLDDNPFEDQRYGEATRAFWNITD